MIKLVGQVIKLYCDLIKSKRFPDVASLKKTNFKTSPLRDCLVIRHPGQVMPSVTRVGFHEIMIFLFFSGFRVSHSSVELPEMTPIADYDTPSEGGGQSLPRTGYGGEGAGSS